MIKKLTQEVFTYCPIWAGWAAVDGNGYAHWYSHKPKRRKIDWICYNPIGETICICGIFDATNWKNSLIKRQKQMK